MKQEEAVRSGLINTLTVITGPPGTGKSQVVVNLLANCAMQGKPVLFVSRNNKAVDVVRAWMTEVLGEEEDWIFRAGSKEKIEELKKRLVDQLMKLDQVRREKDTMMEQELGKCESDIRQIQQEIAHNQALLDEYQQKLYQCSLIMEGIPVAWILHTQSFTLHLDLKTFKKRSFEVNYLAANKDSGLFLRIQRLLLGRRLLLRYVKLFRNYCAELGIEDLCQSELVHVLQLEQSNWEALREVVKKLDLYIQWIVCRNELAELEERIRNLTDMHTLKNRLEFLKEQKVGLSRILFKNKWTEQIGAYKARVHYLINKYFDISEKMAVVKGRESWLALRKEFETVSKQLFFFFPIWIVTSLSARRSLPLTANMFELCIIDEASQCDIPSAFPVLFRAKRAVIIGDPKQLGHVSSLSHQQELKIAEELSVVDLLPTWSYVSNSIYQTSEAAIFEIGSAPILLSEHYRSHPDIINFSNKVFYSDALVVRTNITSLKCTAPGMFWHDVRVTVAPRQKSAENSGEAVYILSLIEKWAQSGMLDTVENIGIVTPFRRQADLIIELIADRDWPESLRRRITVGTVHTFQGDEADIVFFSTVVAPGIHPRKARWVSESETLINVAVTRARGALHVVGHKEVCIAYGGLLAELANYIDGLKNGLAGDSVFSAEYESEAEKRLAEIFDELGFWYRCQYNEGPYRFDFLVISPLGTRYDIEVDGRSHSAESRVKYDIVRDIRTSERGYKVLRIGAQAILHRPGEVKQFLTKLP